MGFSCTCLCTSTACIACPSAFLVPLPRRPASRRPHAVPGPPPGGGMAGPVVRLADVAAPLRPSFCVVTKQTSERPHPFSPSSNLRHHLRWPVAPERLIRHLQAPRRAPGTGGLEIIPDDNPGSHSRRNSHVLWTPPLMFIYLYLSLLSILIYLIHVKICTYFGRLH